ncbi:MAG TPA: nuclear transport factor 2 family protein [Methylocella sp.]|nr:nuclear transport factor 2 family protein [Methylocella sp.]
MEDATISIVRKAYQAYIDKDRAAIEAVIGDGFRFTSPWDNRLNKEAYFDRCWKNSETITGFTFIYLVSDGERVFVTYEGDSKTGRRFRNTEIMTVRDGKIVEAEVYFGWPLPHEAPPGGFVNP